MSDSKMFVPGAALDGLRLALEAENKKLRAEIERLRARVEVLERVSAAAQALIDYEDGDPDEHSYRCWEKKFEALRAALKEAKP